MLFRVKIQLLIERYLSFAYYSFAVISYLKNGIISSQATNIASYTINHV